MSIEILLKSYLFRIYEKMWIRTQEAITIENFFAVIEQLGFLNKQQNGNFMI